MKRHELPNGEEQVMEGRTFGEKPPENGGARLC